jgi:hypothetical protein
MKSSAVLFLSGSVLVVKSPWIHDSKKTIAGTSTGRLSIKYFLPKATDNKILWTTILRIISMTKIRASFQMTLFRGQSLKSVIRNHEVSGKRWGVQ